MEKRVFISEFEAEEMLKDNNYFLLPSLSFFSKRNGILLDGMDGLTISMAKDGDTLVTRKKLPEEYLAYWNENICKVNNCSPETLTNEQDKRSSIYSLLQKDTNVYDCLRNSKIENYAVVPEFYRMCENLGIRNTEPDLATVIKMNSKAYSNSLKIRLDLPLKGINVKSIDEFEKNAKEMLKENGRILIKDSMGVSGKGILPINDEKTVVHLADHFRRQEEQGKRGFDFVIEPLLNKTMDFSCQFHIGKNSEIFIDGYQKNYSKGYSYLGSGPLDEKEYAHIMNSGYRENIEKIAAEMAKDGYHGYACVDSIIADENDVIPLVEINPRMSMGRFNLMLGQRFGQKCRLTYFEGKRSSDCSIVELLDDINRKEILFTQNNRYGVIPLAPCTWCPDDCADQRVRIYFAITYDTDERYKEIYDTWLGHCSGSICTGSVA